MSEEQNNDTPDEFHEQRIKRLEMRVKELEKALHEVGHHIKSLQRGAENIKWNKQQGTLGAQMKNIADWQAEHGRADI
jgi:uncharacterized coiled-coil protein SlyX